MSSDVGQDNKAYSSRAYWDRRRAFADVHENAAEDGTFVVVVAAAAAAAVVVVVWMGHQGDHQAWVRLNRVESVCN